MNEGKKSFEKKNDQKGEQQQTLRASRSSRNRE